jgi:hypothetical protein
MSSEAVWFFLKDQETVGPFSKDVLKEKHEGGEFLPETMVWREGMDGWKPASAISELDIFVASLPTDPPPTTPSAGAPATASGGKFKLKLKSVSKPAVTAEPAPAAPGAPVAAPGTSAPATLPFNPGAAPSGPLGGPKAFLLEGEKKEEKKVEMPKWKKILLRVFSSLIWVPLFMIASGAIVWLFQVRFPNVLWFTYMAAGFGAFGVLSVLGLHWFDKFVRFLALLFLIPPLLLMWPIVTGSGIKNVPPEYWWFAGYCFCYGLTIRMGLRDYLSWGVAGFLCLIGLGVVGFEFAIAREIWQPPAWEKLVEKGSSVRLPATLVRMASLPPHLASSTGKFEFTGPSSSSTYPVERAVLKRVEGRTWQVVVQLVDGQVIGASLSFDGEYEREKVLNQNAMTVFSKDESQELQVTTTQWKTLDNQTIAVGGGILNVSSVVGNRWSGTVRFYSTPEKAAAAVKGETDGGKADQPDAGHGMFEMDVEIRAETR